MKTTKRLMVIQYNYYKELEQKLENYARNGLILKKAGGVLWTFKKSEPQHLKYTVTYFKEGSIFNPEHTDNQLTYFEYAKASGWDFVCEKGQMQIFSSSLEEPTPFETDEDEMLSNIHNCMRKSFIPSQITLILLWIVNLAIRMPSFLQKPMDFLASNLELSCCVLFLSSAIFSSYTLFNYYSWYKKSKKSLEIGGNIRNPSSKVKKILESIYGIFLFALVAYMFWILFEETNLTIIALGILQVPLFIFVFWSVISIQKRLRISAKLNKFVTFLIGIIAGILYCAFVFYMIANFNFDNPTEKPHRVVEQSFLNDKPRKYYLYQDELPLTCEDLYGEIKFDNYSYKKNIDQTIFLKKETYSQNAPPIKGMPPELNYTIYASSFNWVYNLILKALTYRDVTFDFQLETMDNDIFNTNKAYTFYYVNGNEKYYTGEYILVYKDKIIHLDTDEQLKNNEIEIVKEKLQL